jgi:Arc/MetJ-type ribon-helix-helix transcriptional regulator
MISSPLPRVVPQMPQMPQRVRRCRKRPPCGGGQHYDHLLDAKLFRNLKAMEVQLTPDQKAFASQAIQSGRLRREEDAVREALALWEERERTRAEILVAIDEAEASLAEGKGRIISQESMRDLAAEVKQRGRDRLAAE